MLALAIEFVFVIVYSAISPEKYTEYFFKLLPTMIVEMLLYLITKFIDDSINEHQNKKEILNINESLKSINVSIKDDVASKNTVNDLSSKISSLEKTIPLINNASIDLLNTQNEFYEKLSKSRLSAKNKIDLTQLDPWPPKGYKDPDSASERRSYFEQDVEFAKSHPTTYIRRILSIETEEKLQWAKELIESTKGISNLFLAYINIGEIEKSVPFPKMQSIQIIDETEVFLLNPQYAYMPRQYQKCFYIKNMEFAKIYSEYYEEIWKKIENNSNVKEIGCILKNGADDEGYEEKLDIIEMAIKSKKLKK